MCTISTRILYYIIFDCFFPTVFVTPIVISFYSPKFITPYAPVCAPYAPVYFITSFLTVFFPPVFITPIFISISSLEFITPYAPVLYYIIFDCIFAPPSTIVVFSHIRPYFFCPYSPVCSLSHMHLYYCYPIFTHIFTTPYSAMFCPLRYPT